MVAAISWAAVVAALVALVWAITRWRAAAERESQWEVLATRAQADVATLRKLVALKEVELAATKRALVDRMSAGDLADALNGLFGGSAEAAKPAKPPGGTPSGTAK